MGKINKIEVRDRYCIRYGENTFYSTIEAELERSKEKRQKRERNDEVSRKRRLRMQKIAHEIDMLLL